MGFFVVRPPSPVLLEKVGNNADKEIITPLKSSPRCKSMSGTGAPVSSGCPLFPLCRYIGTRRQRQASRLCRFKSFKNLKDLNTFCTPRKPFILEAFRDYPLPKLRLFGDKTPTVWGQNSDCLGTKLRLFDYRYFVPCVCLKFFILMAFLSVRSLFIAAPFVIYPSGGKLALDGKGLSVGE